MNSKTTQLSAAAYQMASDSEECQDSVFGADDSDDVDGNADATFLALKFRAWGLDKKSNACPGRSKNEDSLNTLIPVCDTESSFHANHVAMSCVDKKFGTDVLPNGTESCVYENDCSSEIQDKVLTADNGFSSPQHRVAEDFISFSTLFNEAKQSTGALSFEGGKEFTLSEVQNDLTDFQCNSPKTSNVRLHSGFCSHKYVVCDCSAVQKHDSNDVSNELKSDLPRSRCAVKFNECWSKVIDANSAVSECIDDSSVVEGTGHAIVELCCDLHLGSKGNLNCDGLPDGSSGGDTEDNYKFYANSCSWHQNFALECINSRSNTEDCETGKRIDVMNKNALFQDCLDNVEVTHEDYVDEDDNKKSEDKQRIRGSENEECSYSKEPLEQGSQFADYSDGWEYSLHSLKAQSKKEKCSKDEEEERNNKAPMQEGDCEAVESRNEEEPPDKEYVQKRENTGDLEQMKKVETDNSVITCLEDSLDGRGVMGVMTPDQTCSEEERWCVTKIQKNHMFKCTGSGLVESSQRRMASGIEKIQCQEEGEEDTLNKRTDRMQGQNETEMKGFGEENKNGEENKEEFQAIETEASEVSMSEDDEVLSTLEEITVQGEIEEEEKKLDNNGKEMQSSDERKELYSDSEDKEEMQSDEERKGEKESDEEIKEETYSYDDRKDEIHSDEEKIEEALSDEEEKQEIQSDEEKREEMLSDEEKKKEMESYEKKKEEMQSYEVKNEEMRIDEEIKEDMQSDEARKEEMRCVDEMKEEMQRNEEMKAAKMYSYGKEEIQSFNEMKEEMHCGTENNEEVQSGNERKEEMLSEDNEKEEMQCDHEWKVTTQSYEKLIEEIHSVNEAEEEIGNEDKRKEELHHCERKEKLQSFDERKEEIENCNRKKEIQDDARKAKSPTCLSSPLINNSYSSFQQFMFLCDKAKGEDDEKQHQDETKETQLQEDDVADDECEENVGAIEKKLYGDSIELSSEDKTDLQKYQKDDRKAGLTNLPLGVSVLGKKKNEFVLNLEVSNIATQTCSKNSCSDGVEMDTTGKNKADQSLCRKNATIFCPLNLDYVPSIDANEVDYVFCNESSAENCNLWKSRQEESRVKSSLDAKMGISQNRNLSLSVAGACGPLGERVELNDIPEKFLVPPVCVVVQSNIMTPQEDLGFAKVPGYVPRLDSMEEESEVTADSAADERQPMTKQETDDIAVDVKPSSVVESCGSESDQCETDLFEELQHEERAVSAPTLLGARPKKLTSSLQLSIPTSAPLELSPKLPLSPKPQSKSARPSSLIGLSKPDVNLPSSKPATFADAAAHEEDSSGLIRVKRQDISLTRQRFSFPTSGNFASSILTEVSLLTSPSVLDTIEADSNIRSSLPAIPSSSNEVLPASDVRATSSAKPLAQRPTSWSQPPLKTKSVLPKRPNSLNITVSNIAPIQMQSACTDGLAEAETTTLGLKVPQGTPCLAGSMVVTQPPPAVQLPPSKEPTVRQVAQCNKSYRIGVPESVLQDSPTSISAVPPPISSNINLRITDLGKVAPVWVPDSDAPRCMQCESRFTFTRRRHHCRTCGKVFCSGCCNIKVKLDYLDQKEARVCSRCYQDLLCAQLYENLSPSASHAVNSQVPAAESIRWSSSPSSVSSAVHHAPMSNVMKNEKSVEPKSVSVLDNCYHGNSYLQETEGGKAEVGAQTAAAAVWETLSTGNSKDNRFGSLSFSSKPTVTNPRVMITTEAQQVTQTTIRGPRTPLWPDCNGMNLNVAVMTEASVPSKFTLMPNLKVSVSIVNLDCCLGHICWCFVTSGLCAVGQDEVVIVLERLPDEERIPSDIFYHICDLYREAAKGHAVGYLGHTLVSNDQVLLESADHAGFLYLRPTFQCLQKLPLPPAPYLFGILVHRMEVPWLKVFPIRLMLRLGAQYRYYPCPLVSMRFRESVYREVGHTIMNLLVDLRNFQYRLPRVDGLVVHMEDRKTSINLPRSRFRDIKRAFNNNNDHIVALEVSFSCVADSHLVCFQSPEGKYITQAINIQNRPRKITGASFVVFNGALRPISGMHAKCSMVEDGLMVQVAPESMLQLKQSIASATDYSIGCGRLSGSEPEEWVILKWVDDEKDVKTRAFSRIRSPIDGMALDNALSRRITTSTDYVSESLAIRWTEIFYLEYPADSRQRTDAEFEEVLAQACCMALCHHLEDLQLPALTRIGLRVTLGSQQFGYKIGANCGRLPDVCLRDLDSKLIPVLENPQGCYKGVSLTLELFFYLLEQQQQPQPQHLSPEP